MYPGLQDGIRQRCLETIVVRKYIDAVVEQVKYIICLLGRELREGFSSTRKLEEKIIKCYNQKGITFDDKTLFKNENQ